jgi:hypothetical protein
MKFNKNVIAVSLVVGLGTFVAQSTQASTWIDSGRGPRLTTSSKASMHDHSTMEGRRLSTLDDFENLREGDRIASWCPMMKKTIVTTVRDVDTKGHVKMRETRQGIKMKGCNIVLKRKGGSRQVDTMMVCPDGTLQPAQCRLM